MTRLVIPERGSELYTAAVAGVGVAFFLLAGYTIAVAKIASPPSPPPQSEQRPNPTGSAPTASSSRRLANGATPDAAQERKGLHSRASAAAPSTSPPPPLAGKKTEESTVQVTYPTTWDMCDAGAAPEPGALPGSCSTPSDEDRPLQKVRAGALLRWIDVVAGVCARKHAESSCVTISVDSVLLLKPVYLGDLVHISASCNRAWGSSMEIGVRVVKEDPYTGSKTYVSHSYLTFVAVSRSETGQPPARVRLASRKAAETATQVKERGLSLLGWLTPSLLSSTEKVNESASPKATSSKVQLQPVIPQTPLEARRHIMAGRRRAKRIDNAKRGEARDGVSTEVKRRVKQEVLELSRLGGRRTSGGGSSMEDKSSRSRLHLEAGDVKTAGSDVTGCPGERSRQDIELDALELEFVVEAYVAGDPAVKVRQDQGVVEIHLPGDLPLRHPLDVVERLAKQLRQQREEQRVLTDSQWRPAGSTANPALLSPTGEATTSGAAGGRARVGSAVPMLEDPFSYAAMMESKLSVFSPMHGGLGGCDSESEPAAESSSQGSSAQAEDGGEASTYPLSASATSTTRSGPASKLASGRATTRKSSLSHGTGAGRPIDASKTVARTLHLVFPEHTNSVSVLFGGQLMDWMEEAALLSVRHVGRGRRWSTVGLDGLEFEQAVGIGEVMTFTAIVVRTFVQSCEVYVMAEAEAPNGTRRITNDALFTLAFPLEREERAEVGVDAASRPSGATGGRRAGGLLRRVEMRPGSALETFASVAPMRRKVRLEMRDMLNRLYSQP